MHIRFCRLHLSDIPSEHTFLINVTNYSALRHTLHEEKATSTSADFLTFVVTIPHKKKGGLPRPHGINHTSFIVYLPNLRIKVTVAFGSFTVLSQLVRLIRLSIRFLFVRPRVRYCFFSPKCHHLKLASRYRVRRQLRPEWTLTTDV